MAYAPNSVFKGAFIYTIGQVGTKAFGFFLIPVYTRFLTPAEYGIVGYLQVMMQLMATVLMFGFFGAQTRYYYEFKNNSRKIGEFLFSINAYLITVLLTLCLILTFWGEHLYSLLAIKDIPFYPYLPIVIWIAFFQIMNQLVISYYLATKQYKECALLQFLQFAFMVSMILFFVVYLKQGALGKVKGHLVGQAIFFALFYIPYTRKFIFRFDAAYVKYALAFGVPIVFHLMAGVMHNSIDRIILEKYVSMDQLGIYSLGYQIGMVMSIIVASVNKAWQPNYFDLMSSDTHDRAYENRRMFALWLVGIGSICLMSMLWAKECLILLTPQNFHAAASVVPIIVMGYFFQGIYYFIVSPIFQFKKTKLLPFMTGAAALVNIGLNLILVPYLGIYGAAYATLISFAFQAVLVHTIGRRLFDPQFERLKVTLAIVILLIVPMTSLPMQISIGYEVMKILYFFGFVSFITWLFSSYTKPVIFKLYTCLEKSK